MDNNNNNTEEGLVNNNVEPEESNELNSKKSPKSPKLTEELSEIKLESPLAENSVAEGDGSDDQICDNIKSVIKEIIKNCPAGQVEPVQSLCVELFGKSFEGLIEKEVMEKFIQDGDEFEEAEAEDDDEEEFIKEMRLKLDGYIKEIYPETGSFSIKKTNPNEFRIQILGKRLKPKAFWSGHWHSIWTVEFKEEQSEGFCFALNGKIELTVHYHEEGTVQLSASKEIPSRVDFRAASLPLSADKIYWKIKDSEDAVQLALNEAYRELAENTFKKLRRQLPVTRTKMDWNHYKFRAEIKK